MESLPKTADVVIIGGGSVGTSIAYHLARRDSARVVLLERENIASGSTGRAAGLVTQQHKSALHIAMAKESIDFFRQLARNERFGLIFRETGYAYLICTHEELAQARQSIALQKSLGVDSHLLDPDETAELIPGLATNDILGATNCPTDGYTDPYLAANAFAALAKEHGAKVFVSTSATGLAVENGRIRSVATEKGEIEVGMVVNAAGPWAALVGEMAGLDIPVRPFRRQLWFTHTVEEVAETAPILFDTFHDYYFRKEGNGVLMCLGNPAETSSFSTAVDWNFASKVAEFASHRFPPFTEARIISAWAAPRDMTPDHEPILGRIPGVDGLVVAAGGSGHGFMLSPAIGRLIAELILDGQTSLDLSPLSIERFGGKHFPLSAYTPIGA